MDVGLKGLPRPTLHAQDDLNKSSMMDGSSTDAGLKAIPPSTLHEQDDLNEESSRLDGGSTDVGLKQIPPLRLHKQDDLNEDSSRVDDLSNGTSLRARQKPISNFTLASGFASKNNEGHTIASRSNTHEVCEDIVDGHACWRIKGGLISAEKNTKWYKALLVNDCKSLMEQLDKNGSLVVQTGYNGRTVLLAAVRRGCTPLVNQVMDLFKDDAGDFITGNDYTKISQSPLHDLFQAEDFGTKLRAVEIMQQFMGSDIILCHMNAFYGSKFPLSLLLSVDALTGNDVERQMIAHEGKQLKGDGQSGVPMISSKIHAKTHMRNNLASKNNTHLEHNNYDINPLHGKTKSIPIKKTPIVSLTHTNGDDEHIDVTKVDILAKIRNIIDKLMKTKKFEALRGEYSKHKDYNFDKKCTEFLFHYACQSMTSILMPRGASNNHAEDFLWSFFKELGGEEDQKILQGSDGDKILQSLYEIKNWQGKTPCHAALNGSAFGFEKLLGLLRCKNDPMTIKLFLNACDARGWTPLHKAVAMVSEHDCWGHRRFINLLLKNEEVNVNGKLPISQATPLHLAILHNLPRVVGLLIHSPKNREEVLNASLTRNIRFSNTTEPSRWSSNWWSPLQLAAIMGHHGVVEELITKIDMIYEVSKLKNKGVAPKNYDDKIPSVHLAAASGVPEVLELFLEQKPKIFDPSKTTKNKRSTLHFAVDTTAPYMDDKPTYFVNNFMNPFQCILDFGNAQHLEYIITKESKKNPVVGGYVGKNNHKAIKLDQDIQKNHKRQLTTLEEYGGKQTCITMLLQDGVDIWQRDDQWKFAEPGAETSNEIRMWWFQKKSKERSATTKALSHAANAISVVAALIATASYVGPLQPPLGFGTVNTSSYFDFVQTSSIPVQIFVISNCLSFYLAIGSIMFAIVPSVPMPKQGIGFDEWQRSKRTVGAALSLLLFSVFCVVVSFAAASNAGMSDNDSYKHVGLAFYPAMFGGIPCLIGITVFSMGFLRFITSFSIGIKNDIRKGFASESAKGSQVGDEANDKENLQAYKE